MTGKSLPEQAVAILRANERGGYTVPTARLYPYQWNWDAGFTALGWATFDEARAWRELEKLFEGQWADGLLPHIVFHQVSPDYFPGPDIWGARDKAAVPTTGISQPPVSASVVRWLWQHAKDRAPAEEQTALFYPKLLAHHRWWHSARDPDNTGLVCTYHPWETGRDNSPEWDAPFAAVPQTDTVFQRRDTALVDNAERPHQSEYRRYIYLVELFRSLDYEPRAVHAQSPFRVFDIGINAILARADRDLLVLGERFGSAEEQMQIQGWLDRTRQVFDKLWNAELRCYNGYDLIADKALALPVSAGFLPLFAGIPDRDRAQQMAAELERWRQHARYSIPSLAPDHPGFEPRRYWRGPAWSIVNYMVALGLLDYGFDRLAGQIRDDTRALTELGEFHEYFSPVDGQGCGGGAFSWTAAIALWWGFE